ncbi:uncharacterized protein VTP21DRAFT_1059 [Calcarisporiella thermophila]|uniref:uncharacterized protein n=1 Tax=Calcarisporiella thermophila TaxID=911321 RepID=UPI003743145F
MAPSLRTIFRVWSDVLRDIKRCRMASHREIQRTGMTMHSIRGSPLSLAMANKHDVPLAKMERERAQKLERPHLGNPTDPADVQPTPQSSAPSTFA